MSDAMGELVAAIVQDAVSGRVLMLGWMDDEARRRTVESGEVWFWSRSRGRLWKKGETSGNILRVVAIKADCDGDALLVRAEPAGPTCHTGSVSCFGSDGKEPAPTELDKLAAVIDERLAAPHGTRSYVRSLAEDPAKLAAKVVEEAGELAAELPSGPRERVIAEAADVLFHALVGLRARGVSLSEVATELHRRAGVSGLDEKAARGK